MAIPGARRGSSSSVCRAMAISRRRMGPHCMASGSRPRCSYGP
jgi:hypothetical protein